MEIQKAISRLKKFCEEVKDLKENECEAKYDVIAMETVLNELEIRQNKIEELEDKCLSCPREPKNLVAQAVMEATQPVMAETKPVNDMQKAISEAITKQLAIDPSKLSKNIMRGGAM